MSHRFILGVLTGQASLVGAWVAAILLTRRAARTIQR